MSSRRHPRDGPWPLALALALACAPVCRAAPEASDEDAAFQVECVGAAPPVFQLTLPRHLFLRPAKAPETASAEPVEDAVPQSECLGSSPGAFRLRLPAHAYASLAEAFEAIPGPLPAMPGRPLAPRASSTGVFTVRWSPAYALLVKGLAYELQRSAGDGPYRTIAWVHDTLYREKGLPQGVYSYRVRAITNEGLGGQFSAVSPAVRIDRSQPIITVEQDRSGAFRIVCAKPRPSGTGLVNCGLDSSGGVVAVDAAGNRAQKALFAFSPRTEGPEELHGKAPAILASPSAILKASRRGGEEQALFLRASGEPEAGARQPPDDQRPRTPGAFNRLASARGPPGLA